jgi:hypothetical protein
MSYCPKCKSKWTGLGRAHYCSCHQTFNSVSSFDKHRKNFACLDPLDLKMEMNEHGIWRVPLSDEQKMRLGYATKTA